MTDIFALVGAIALIVLVLTLRNLLAIPYRRETARFVAAAPPKGTESLFDEAQQQLRALGFDEGRWIITTCVDGSPSFLPLRVVHAHAEGTMVAVGSPISSTHPHRLHVYFADRLEDGRTAISQAFDPYFEVTQTDEVIARTSGETSLSAQYLAHRTWLAGLGVGSIAVDEVLMLDLIGGMMERQRQALIKSGALRALSPDRAVPSLRFALRIFNAVRNMPKTPADPRPVPAERLALLARNQELIQQRAPSRPVQWSLFGVSVALFMALGALFWEMQFAFFILVVVLIHELGHFLAMRAFGYRNVHLMALPLVGGVAIGVDANPAASRRAWMSLMGPLPGILIGWALAAVWMFAGLPQPYQEWLGILALLFLAINYLNVLPVPPLDGAHVVSSLLPPRWARVEAAFLAVAASIGALLAWYFGFVVITVVAALQLFQVPVLWRQHGVERDLASELAPGKGHRSQRLLRVLRELERRQGPTSAAGERIKIALSILLRLDTRPMSALAWLSTSAVYFSLLLVPVAGLLVFGLGMAITGITPEANTAHYQQLWEERVQLQRDASALGLHQLIGELDNPLEPAAPAASPEAISAAESRLGRALPEELRALYLQQNGISALGLHPIEDLQSAQAVIERDLAPYAASLSFEAGDDDDAPWVEIATADAGRWWYLGGVDEQEPLFYLPEVDPRLGSVRVVRYFIEAPETHDSLRAWLESSWVAMEQSQREQQRNARDNAAMQLRLADAPVGALLANWQPPDLLTRLLSRQSSWPAGADADARSMAEQRLGLDLPADYWALLELHDGFPPLQLLPLSELAALDNAQDFLSARGVQDPLELRAAGDDDGDPAAETTIRINTHQLGQCLVAAAFKYPNGATGAQTDVLVPSMLWCPRHRYGPLWIDLDSAQHHPSFDHWLRARAAQMAAMRMRES